MKRGRIRAYLKISSFSRALIFMVSNSASNVKMQKKCRITNANAKLHMQFDCHMQNVCKFPYFSFILAIKFIRICTLFGNCYWNFELKWPWEGSFRFETFLSYIFVHLPGENWRVFFAQSANVRKILLPYHQSECGKVKFQRTRANVPNSLLKQQLSWGVSRAENRVARLAQLS